MVVCRVDNLLILLNKMGFDKTPKSSLYVVNSQKSSLQQFPKPNQDMSLVLSVAKYRQLANEETSQYTGNSASRQEKCCVLVGILHGN